MTFRILRFKLRTLLLLFPVIAICTALWVHWPNRTARDFATALQTRDIEHLSIICPVKDVFDEFDLGGQFRTLNCSVTAKKRTMADILCGQGNYTISVLFVGETYWGEPLKTWLNFHVKRGRVKLESKKNDIQNFSIPLAATDG